MIWTENSDLTSNNYLTDSHYKTNCRPVRNRSALPAGCLLTTDLIIESIEATRENQRQLNHVSVSINLLRRIFRIDVCL